MNKFKTICMDNTFEHDEFGFEGKFLKKHIVVNFTRIILDHDNEQTTYHDTLELSYIDVDYFMKNCQTFVRKFQKFASEKHTFIERLKIKSAIRHMDKVSQEIYKGKTF